MVARLESLQIALAAGDGRLDPDAAKRARDVLDRTGERLRLGADRTVVALVGATGSGKSSLFNALAGMEVAEVGVRRPTTGEATACVWAVDGADALLDWLGVPKRQRTNRESVLDADRQNDLHGLVLLDLPDHDSTSLTHRLEVDRLVELVDLLVWVVDPQKYADEALHYRYLRRMVGHEAVMLVVLNQLDRLSPAEAQTCAIDLRRLLDADGLNDVRLLTTSARTGSGIEEFRAVLSDLVRRRGAFAGRAMADLERSADELRAGVARAEPEPTQLPGSEQLVAALAHAAGLPVMLDAVTADYHRQAAERTGWPPLRWWRRWRPDALSRLGLEESDEAQVRELTRVSAPAPTPAQRSQVELAVREVTGAAAQGMPQPWTDDIRQAGVEPSDDLSDSLDAAVQSVDLTLRRPGWWGALTAVQVGLIAITMVGLVWLFVLGVASWTGSGLAAPFVGPMPLPTVLLIGGAALGAVSALAARWFVRLGARRHRARVAAQLRSAVSAVAVERVIAPVAAVVIDHRTVREALGRPR
ncbi:MAG TPA: GTPase [Kineosporiaceae bacterium]|nr:GTPase [Kineosporiaceae bacterium]